MRTGKKTHALLCSEISFHFPKNWKEMTQRELRLVLEVMAAVPDRRKMKMICLLRMNGVTVVRRLTGGWLCSMKQKRKTVAFAMKAEQMAWMVERLGWMDEYDSMQNRLEKAGGGNAVDMTLHGVTFEDYLNAEKYYQLYLRSERREFLASLGSILYIPKKGELLEDFTPGELTGILLWWIYIKETFARAFPNFFRRTNAADDSTEAAMSIIMQYNIQMRALTGGDVTREDAIRGVDCWRALTELDAKALEAKEHEQRMKELSKK